MEGQKKRTPNFSGDEKRILSELVLQYQSVIENKHTDATTNLAKLKGWVRLAEEFNNISTYTYRSHTALKCCWENIKRQTKKDRANRKKKIFMTGGGKPPSPPPPNQEAAIVEAVLGPALEGIPNIYDSDADAVICENIEVIEITSHNEDTPATYDTSTPMENKLKGNKENEDTVQLWNHGKDTNCQEINEASTSKGILQGNNNDDNWSSWSPKNLKTPISTPLRTMKQKEDNWLTRRRPKSECLGDTITKEKIKLIKILQENAEKESKIRLSILEEQLKQEQIKTQKLLDNK